MIYLVSVADSTESALKVAVKNVDGSICITMGAREKEFDLSPLKAGSIFNIKGIEYIVLEQFANKQTAIIHKELLSNSCAFYSGKNHIRNDWRASDIRRFLNGEYLKVLDTAFGRGRIIEHTVDLLSMDGLDDYGSSNDRVSLLTFDQYRKYRKVLGNLYKKWWLTTPDSTLSGESNLYAQYVNDLGDVRCARCDNIMGIRPFFIVQS